MFVLGAPSWPGEVLEPWAGHPHLLHCRSLHLSQLGKNKSCRCRFICSVEITFLFIFFILEDVYLPFVCHFYSFYNLSESSVHFVCVWFASIFNPRSRPTVLNGCKCSPSLPIPVPTQIHNYQRMEQNLQPAVSYGSTRHVHPPLNVVFIFTIFPFCLGLTMSCVTQGWQQQCNPRAEWRVCSAGCRCWFLLPNSGKWRKPTTTSLPMW